MRGFVILSGVSGTGKTWLASEYAKAVGAELHIEAVAPNWTTNEDLIGYFNPLTEKYVETPFSAFVAAAASEFDVATGLGVEPRPYHLILDEMNLARVEYYFATFLAAMETRAREGRALLQLGPAHHVWLTPNLRFVGTVNVDETTHGFADKVYDRAQLIELHVTPELLRAHLGDDPLGPDLVTIWEMLQNVAPFAFRVLDEIRRYVDAAATLQVARDEAFDEQLLQKVLPKVKGADLRVGVALEGLCGLAADRWPLTAAKAASMLEGFRGHGIASYF